MVTMITDPGSFLSYDDDGRPDGMQVAGSANYIVRYNNIQQLLVDWLPSSEEGGYAVFIEENGLQGVVPAKALERLFTDTNTRMGKNLAGILSLLVPPEYCTWHTFKNIYGRGLRDSEKETIDISDEAKQQFIEDLASIDGLEFAQILRMLRRANFLSQRGLAEEAQLFWQRIGEYERGVIVPTDATVQKLCDALDVDKDTRMLLLDAAGKGARAKLEDPETFRQGLRSIIGGGTIFGALLCNLRKKKGFTQRGLAEEAQLFQQQIGKYERGVIVPTDATVQKLCDALDVGDEARELLEQVAENAREVRSDGPLNKAAMKVWRVAEGAQKTHFDGVPDEVIAKLDNPETFREGLISIVGGGSIFGVALYKLRMEKGWTQEKLAERVGVTQQTIAKYQRGIKVPEVSMIDKICNALGVSQDMHVLMLDVARMANWQNIDDKEAQREVLKVMLGGRSIFGAALYRLRTGRCWTQKKLAEESDVLQEDISRYETDQGVPNSDKLDKLCDALNVDQDTRELLEQVIENAREARKSSRGR